MKSILSILLFTALLSSCVSTQKLFDKGEYDKAFYGAVNDLKKNASNADALRILPDAYKEAAAKYEQDIAVAKTGKGRKTVQLGLVYNGYLSLQKMYEAYENAGLKMNNFSPKNYNTELNAVAGDAAEAEYNRGLILLQQNNRVSARKAYDRFKMVDGYVPGYKDVIVKKQQAYDAAITNVVVNRLDQRFGAYSINGSFFEDDILRNLNSIGNNSYFEFYSIGDRRSTDIRVDEYIDLNMFDIWFSNLATNTYAYTVTKKIAVKNDKMANSESTITVSATIRVTRRVINSRAVMNYRITDAASRKIIAAERIPAQYTWESLTGKYTGDSKALSERDWAIINGNYKTGPSYDDLYRELTRQIMSQFNFKMREIYHR